MSLDALFGFAMWLYLLWPFTMVKRLGQYWDWLGNKPDYHLDLDGKVVNPRDAYTAYWQLQWFPWLQRYLPHPPWTSHVVHSGHIVGASIPEYGHHDPTDQQIHFVLLRVNWPLGIWLVCGALALCFHSVPEGRWVALGMAHAVAFSSIWILNWKDNDLSETRLLSRPRGYIFRGIFRDRFPHTHSQPTVAFRARSSHISHHHVPSSTRRS